MPERWTAGCLPEWRRERGGGVGGTRPDPTTADVPIVLRRTVQAPRYHESRLRRPRDIVPAQELSQRIDSA
jgi:hypothetical protein